MTSEPDATERCEKEVDSFRTNNGVCSCTNIFFHGSVLPYPCTSFVKNCALWLIA